jgi:hypothetical protein
MTRMMMMTVLMMGLIFVTALSVSAKEINQRGFTIQYDVTKWSTCEVYYGEVTNSYHGSSYNRPQIAVHRPIEHTAIEGKVMNEFFRHISHMTFYFEAYDSNDTMVEEKAVSVNSLGSHESRTFSMSIDNRIQKVILKAYEFFYLDGTCEKISMK